MSKLDLTVALEYCVFQIEKRLNVEVCGIRRVTKIYGSNANSFVLTTINSNNETKRYFLKFSRLDSLQDEINGTKLVQKYIPTPNIILDFKSEKNRFDWVLTEYIEGELMSEYAINYLKKGSHKKLLKLERAKEKLIIKLYNSKPRKLDYEAYLGLNANKLFYERLTGKRFKEYFVYDKKLSQHFNKKIVLNGTELRYSISEIFELIREKYRKPNHNYVPAYIGHGDAHQGNILIDDKIWFIDNEYADHIPSFMEISKPYYNDFIGSLFFHHSDMLNKMFVLNSFEIDNKQIIADIKLGENLYTCLELLKIKLTSRRETVNHMTTDFLSLNDYLVLCHTLTKNPNEYDESTRVLFLILSEVLYEFDALEPDSILRYF